MLMEPGNYVAILFISFSYGEFISTSFHIHGSWYLPMLQLLFSLYRESRNVVLHIHATKH